MLSPAFFAFAFTPPESYLCRIIYMVCPALRWWAALFKSVAMAPEAELQILVFGPPAMPEIQLYRSNMSP